MNKNKSRLPYGRGTYSNQAPTLAPTLTALGLSVVPSSQWSNTTLWFVLWQ